MAEQTQAVQAQAPQKSPYDTYQTSLTSRYCSNEMTSLFSQRSRHSTWRKLWLGLAESESELGIDIIKPEALDQMRAHLTVTDDDFEVARAEEKIRRHVSRRIALVSVGPEVLIWVRLGCHGCKPPTPCDIPGSLTTAIARPCLRGCCTCCRRCDSLRSNVMLCESNGSYESCEADQVRLPITLSSFSCVMPLIC